MKKWIRKIIRGLSITSVLFVFQACYGTPQDFGQDLLIEGQVKSKKTGLPIKGIKVSTDEQYEFTDKDGNFSFYTIRENNLKINFEDVDAAENGNFSSKDTILTNVSRKVYLDINLNEK